MRQKEKIYSKCIVCDIQLEQEDDKFMVALEVPYMNLFLHKDCYNKIKDILLDFLIKNLEKYINIT